MTRVGTLARLLRSDRATAALEFGLAAPLLLLVGLAGAEAVNRAMVEMQINQLAALTADNISRVGENSLLGEVELFESDINDVFRGVDLQSGKGIALLDRGRVIISSLEVVAGTEDQQYIHWQRCKGKLAHASSYGNAGDGKFTGIDGMGPAGAKVKAIPGEAAMFVEVAYDYRPLIGNIYGAPARISAIAAFNVRNNRDLSGVKQRSTTNPDPVSSCNKFDSFSA